MRWLKIISLGSLAVLLLIVLLALFAFQKPIDGKAGYDYAAETAPGPADMRLSIMVTATVMAPEAIMFEGGSWTKSRKMGHSAILVCHPEGLLMFDTGLGRDIDLQFKDMPSWLKPLFPYEVSVPAIEQLDQEAFCPGRKLQIILSHLHWDHASGIEDFSGVPVWTPASELSSGRDRKNSGGYLFSQFDSPDIDWKTLEFKKTHYENYQSSLDFFGDGRVVLIPMFGHSEGSTGMFIDLGDGGKYFFTGDTTWSVEGFTRPAHKHALMRKVVDGNVDETEKEIGRVHALMERNPDLHVVPAHDYEAYITEAIYPDFVTAR